MRAQRAALRKLQHELGIRPEELARAGFRFLTRLHYCAADEGTYGPDAEWGEHEARPDLGALHLHRLCVRLFSGEKVLHG